MNTLPCCFFPTTILMVDDNKAYLSNLSLLLNQYSPVRFETSPNSVVQIIEDNYLKPDFILNCIQKINRDEIEDDTTDSPLIRLNINKLLHISKLSNRFGFITLLLIDYSMPHITGIDLCKQLRHIPIKKVMVTGEANLNTAVDAFNAGIIDKFIEKNSPNFKENIQEMISVLQESYFLQLSKELINIIDTAAYWKNPLFINFFNEIKSNLKATEYYLLDHHGSFLFLDAKGSPTILAIQSAEDIKRYYHIALENDGPLNIVTSLKNNTHFPFFMLEEHLKSPVSKWGDFLHEAHQIPGMNIYYTIIARADNNKYFNNNQYLGITDFLHTQHIG